LTVSTLGLNTFRVNSITLQNQLLFLGIENYGFGVYDMNSMGLSNLVSIQSLVPNPLFQVSQIVAENDFSLYLVSGGFGLIQVNSNSNTQQLTWNSVTMETLMIFDSNDQTKSDGYVVAGPAGFAYLDRDNIIINGNTYI